MDLLQSLQEAANEAEKMLKDNTEWIERYAGYASDILANLDTINEAWEQFNERKPLYVYSSITRAKSASKNQVSFDLRYRGQSVAEIIYKKGKVLLEASKDKKTSQFYKIEGGKTVEWDSKEARLFRSAFSKNPDRNDEGKKNEEHRYESALLTELSKEKGDDKVLKHIQPVRLIKCRFQMRTPFAASKGVSVYKKMGGCIDILCRTKHGNKSVLNVFELKDEYENPEKVLRQALIYSVFIFKLLKTPKAGSDSWWKLFGFSKAPDPALPLTINAVVAMPKHDKNDKSFANKKIKIDGGTINLHYFYFSLSKTDVVTSVDTSLQ